MQDRQTSSAGATQRSDHLTGIPVTMDDAHETLKFTSDIIDECGPRLAGDPATLKSSKMLQQELAKVCDRALLEEFEVHPDAFLGFLRVMVAFHFAGLACLLIGWFPIAAVLFGIAGLTAVLQFIFYRRLLDPFFPKATGYNVVGIVEPQGEVRQQIIISGHHDSAYEFNYMKRGTTPYTLLIAACIISVTASFVIGTIAAIAIYTSGTVPGFVEVFRYAALGTIPFVLPMWFFLGKPTPGAGDNLIASTIAVQLARVFRRAKDQGGPSLQHTRLMLVSFDAEESGLRGSAAFAARHKAELHQVPTTVLNMDSLYELDQLQFVTRDVNGSIAMPKYLVEEVMELSAKLGYPSRKFPMLFGAGGTDAAEFLRIGVPATTLLAMDTRHFQSSVNYHTQKDTVDKIHPDVVKAALDIAWAFVWKREHGNP